MPATTKIVPLLILTIFSLTATAQYNSNIEELINNKDYIRTHKTDTIEITETEIGKGNKMLLQAKGRYTFDEKGNKASHWDYCIDRGACDTIAVKETTYKYNTSNDPVEVTTKDIPSNSIIFNQQWQYIYKEGKVSEEKTKSTEMDEWSKKLLFYDSKGLVIKEKISVAAPNSDETSYYYSSKNNLDSIVHKTNTSKETQAFMYDAAANKIKTYYKYQGKQIGGNALNGEEFEYYPDKKLKSKTITGYTTISKEEYTYANGNLVEIKKSEKSKLIKSDFKLESTTSLQYDESGLLVLIRETYGKETTETTVKYK